MKLSVLITLFFAFATCGSCQDWRNYHGDLDILDGNQKIELKILFLNEGVVFGSYIEHDSPIQYKLVGNINNDSIRITVRAGESDELQGFLIGKLSREQQVFQGLLYDDELIVIGSFEVEQVFGESYTDFIREHRALYEYETFEEALRSPKDVQSIDVANQGLEEIPNIFDQFKRLLSINLLGNSIDSFPVELIKAKGLKELSLSSNGLLFVGEEIGELTELRILIMNFNNLREIPREIGNLTQLLYLDLGHNQINHIPNEISKLIKLEELHLDDNELSEDEKVKIQGLLPNCVIHFGTQRE